MRSRKIYRKERKVLEPQSGADAQRPPDPYRRSQLEKRKEKKKQWKGMEDRRLYQRSLFKLQAEYKKEAERMLALRRAHIEHGISSAPHVSDNHTIKPVSSGIPEGLPKIKEAKPRPSDYFPREFVGYPTRPRTPPSWPGRSTHLFESNLPKPYTRTEPPQPEYRGSRVASPTRSDISQRQVPSTTRAPGSLASSSPPRSSVGTQPFQSPTRTAGTAGSPTKTKKPGKKVPYETVTKEMVDEWIRQDQEYEEQLRRLQNLRLSSEQNRETGYDTDEDSEFGD